jgi:hypothetical protein
MEDVHKTWCEAELAAIFHGSGQWTSSPQIEVRGAEIEARVLAMARI